METPFGLFLICYITLGILMVFCMATNRVLHAIYFCQLETLVVITFLFVFFGFNKK